MSLDIHSLTNKYEAAQSDDAGQEAIDEWMQSLSASWPQLRDEVIAIRGGIEKHAALLKMAHIALQQIADGGGLEPKVIANRAIAEMAVFRERANSPATSERTKQAREKAIRELGA